MITRDEVKHIARLAKIKLSESEIKKFSGELSRILDYFKMLQEVETENVEETSQVTGLRNVLRPDEIEMCEYEAELLKCSPHPIEENCIKIPKIM